MLYHYIDESFKSSDHYYHGIVGGILVPCEQAVEFEIEIERCIPKKTRDGKIVLSRDEFKYSAFCPEVDDDEKIARFDRFVDVLRRLEVRTLVSHAKIRKDKLRALFNTAGKEHLEMQSFAWFNMCRYLEGRTKGCVVQAVVDLGLSESFKPLYNQYVGVYSGVASAVSAGFKDEHIIVPNFRNLPMPLFVDSKNSRAVQISDVIIGLLLARETNTLSPLMKELSTRIAPIESQIELHSAEWNKFV